MHGTGDNIVPYNWLGNNMQNSLSNPTLGGLINGSVYNNTAIPTSATYATTTQKHLIKLIPMLDMVGAMHLSLLCEQM
mgnify:CR=1 FL=1